MIFSCNKNDDETTIAIRDFDEQYATDEAALQKFFKDYHMEVDADFNVTFTKIETGSTDVSIKDQTTYTMIDTNVVYNSKQYKIHFIKFREGDNVLGKRPTQVDSVYVSYKGMGLDGDQFDGADNPIWFDAVQNLVPGWSSILPSFLSGTYSSPSPADPPVFNNYGAGIMFLHSGFGYFNSSVGDLGSYAPLIFNFKLYEVKYRDHDGDGILSKNERDFGTLPKETRWKVNPFLGYDFNGDFVLEKYDTDGDGFINMYDVDDDNDRFSTKYEIKNPVTGIKYPFDDIPDCSGNQTNPSRIKIHLVKCN